MTISDERKKQVDFSDIYFNAGQSLLVKREPHHRAGVSDPEDQGARREGLYLRQKYP